MENIDLVVPWVNGADSAWLSQKGQYVPENRSSNSDTFYRDWELMRYWFRGVEKNLPWIHKIYFLTWGHLPAWLNVEHPKLQIVRHEDFIPAEFRPTFSSNPIELNIHRIEGLSEQFIYANDDTFFIGKLEPEYYFKSGLPCDCLCLRPITEACEDGFGHVLWNNIACINRNFSMADCMEESDEKWFSELYPDEVMNLNRTCSMFRNFPGFRDEHLPIPFLKSTFEEVWEKENRLLRRTSSHKFRSNEDVSAWLMRYWRLVKGEFVPRVPEGIALTVSEPVDVLRDAILSAKNPVICLNDSLDGIDFEDRSRYIRSLFEIIMPEMSSFELY
ncbi:MAG: stealth conserved region 3 domain-containing protein [Oscillospiraceae bacterium]|nr:stealth conserved region 3 domain-containing protein [Oscillospiraceae bacterium]